MVRAPVMHTSTLDDCTEGMSPLQFYIAQLMLGQNDSSSPVPRSIVSILCEHPTCQLDSHHHNHGDDDDDDDVWMVILCNACMSMLNVLIIVMLL